MNLNTAGWASRALAPLLRIIRSSPNATVPVVVISGPVNSETAGFVNSDIALLAKGTGATLAQVPDGTAVGGNKRGTSATDLQKNRTSASQIASGTSSVISGGLDNTASGNYSIVGGGQRNNCSNTLAVICGGQDNVANGGYTFVGGGQSNSATALRSTVAGGVSNTASATSATVCGGQGNGADGYCSFVAGGFGGYTRSIDGYHVFPASYDPLGLTSGSGILQSALLLLCRETTTATATVLASNSSSPSATNQVTLPNNSAYYFKGSVIAGVTGGGNSKAWSFEGAIKRGANAASTAIVGTVVLNTIAQDAGASAWTIAITADTTNGAIAVTVTGAASTTIRWMAKIETTEMTY